MYGYRILIIIGMLSLGLSWPWQEQAQDGGGEYRKPSSDMAINATAPIDESLDAAVRMGTAAQKLPSVEMEKLDALSKIPEVTRQITGDANDEKSKSLVASKTQNAEATAAANLRAFNAIEVTEKIRDLNLSQLSEVMEISRNQMQVDRAMVAVEKIRQAELEHLEELNRVMNLSQRHRVIMEELKKAEEKGSDVTVIDREDILQQEELRAMREKPNT